MYNGKLMMTNNGTGHCNITVLNAEENKITLKKFWTNSVEDPVQLFINDKPFLNFTNNIVQNYSLGLEVGIHYFLLPARKSFTVIFSRIKK